MKNRYIVRSYNTIVKRYMCTDLLVSPDAETTKK